MHKITKVASALLLVSAHPAFAGNGDSDIRWSGYMSLVGGILKDKSVNDLTTNKQVPGIVGYENRFTGMQDSLFALQASKPLNPKLSITGQIVARGSVDAFQNQVTWAYGTYEIDDNSSLRFGRLGLPTFYYSDFMYVGTTYHWITPPKEVYDFAISYEGINYLRHDTLANIDLTTEMFAGSFNQELNRPDGSTWKTTFRDSIGLSLTANAFSWLTARVMATQGTGAIDTNYDIEGLLASVGISGDIAKPAIADGKSLVNDSGSMYTYYNLGLKADFEHWFLMSEAMRVDSGALLPFNWRRWYVSTGLHFGKVTYHVTYGRSEDNYSPAENLFTDFISKPVAAMIADSAATDNQSLTVGARIDTTRTTAVKVELTQFEEFASRESETAGIGKNMLARVAFNASF